MLRLSESECPSGPGKSVGALFGGSTYDHLSERGFDYLLECVGLSPRLQSVRSVFRCVDQADTPGRGRG